MDLMLLRVFQRQVESQLRCVLLASREIDAALARMHKGDTGAMAELWFSVQNLLTAAANVSKACWGQSHKQKVLAAARKPLRDSIGIKNTSPIRRTAMRNNFDHFDERLDEWWATSKNHNHADNVVGPGTVISGIDPRDMFRVLDTATMELVFWGQRFDLRAIVVEADRLLQAVSVETQKPHWVP
jgi:hypothetical protein